MYIAPRALEGLRIWAMLWGQNRVNFDELIAAKMLGFFVLSEYETYGYLNRGHDEGISLYNLTDRALEVVRETA
jgi:hypothetical protein